MEADRYQQVTVVAGKLMEQGYVVFSPITHSHPVARAYPLPCTWEFWQNQDFTFLSVCWKVFLLTLDGWQTSVGVTAEIAEAERLGIPVEYLRWR